MQKSSFSYIININRVLNFIFGNEFSTFWCSNVTIKANHDENKYNIGMDSHGNTFELTQNSYLTWLDQKDFVEWNALIERKRERNTFIHVILN